MRAPVSVKDERVGDIAIDDSADAGGAELAQQILKKGPWTAKEDAILREYVRKHGEGNWNAVQKNSGLQRCGKSCRLRWANHLRPNLKKGSFSSEEEMLILQLHADFGNKWARMAAHLPGRTDNEIKNYWNTRIKRRQRAGLPLYPVEIQQQMAVRTHRQGQAMPWMDNSQPSLKPLSQTPLSMYNSTAQALSQNQFGTFFQGHNRGKSLSFQFPLSSVSPTAVFPSFQLSTNYGLGNFDLGPLPQPIQTQPSYSVKMELPSSQFFSGPGGEQMAPLSQDNSGLLDALLQESHGVGNLLSSKCLPMDTFGKLGDSDCSIGIQVKQEVNEMKNPGTSTLLDIIPSTQTATPTIIPSDWYNNNCGGEISNGPSSVVTTDDDIGLEMQQLASTLSMAPGEHDWCLGSCSWDNMPSIC